VTRTLAPLGVVLKAGRWYLVAQSGERVTAYRVGSIESVDVLDEPVTRPAGFDLAESGASGRTGTRAASTAPRRGAMTVEALGRMTFVFPPEMSRVARARAQEPDADGWLLTVVPIESVRHGHIELLKLGADADVLSPPELRACFAATARGLAATYLPDPDPCDRMSPDRMSPDRDSSDPEEGSAP
jgi:predicted DNA-binding transcriptional regulator YafY